MTAVPRVSVVMAAYNGGRYIRAAIESVLSQDFRDLELVIVDDASTDDTRAIVDACQDGRIVYVRNAGNLGQTRSLNLGLATARGEFVARIDADDLFGPGKLSRQVALMAAEPDVAVCGTAATRIDADGRPFGKYVPPVRPTDVRFCLCQRVPVCHVSVMMRRDVVTAVGGYDESYLYAADYQLWSVLARSGRVITNVDEPLMLYREFTESLGHVHKLGAAGDEGARIIQANIAAFAGLTVGVDECRAIALQYFPSAGLNSTALAKAHVNLKAVARKVYGRLPMRVRVELLSLLFWSLLKLAADRSPGAARTGDSFWRTARAFAGHPTIAMACVLARSLSWVGGKRLHRLKEAVMPVLLRRLR